MKTFYKLFAVVLVFLAVDVNAQLTTPMLLKVNSPAAIAATYDYGAPSDFGPTTLAATITGDAAWGTDSLGCVPFTNDLTGKVGLVRRGGCSFSLKIYHAQLAGAVGAIIINNPENATPNATVGMLGGDSASLVTIPSVFLPLNDGSIISDEVDMGTAVSVSFFLPSIDEAAGLYHYATPQSQIRTLDSFNIRIYNNDNDPETNVVATVNITEPTGNIVTLTENIGQIDPGTGEYYYVQSTYTPTDLGVYSIEYTVASDSNTFAGEVLNEQFEITDHTWSNSSNENVRGIFYSGFDTDIKYDIGNTYFPTAMEEVTHVSFALENPDSLDAQTFDIVLYDADSNDDGLVDDYDTWTAIGAQSYVVDAAVLAPNDTILIELFSLGTTPEIMVSANQAYVAMVEYDALSSANSALTAAPEYLHSSGIGFVEDNTFLVTNGGLSSWSAATNAAAYVKLHTKGYVVANSTNVRKLEDTQVTLFPNPTTEVINLDLNLNEISETVNVQIIDIQGRILKSESFNNIKDEVITLNVANLAKGNYFLHVQTDEGYRTKNFVVIK
jgi:hypothetical protein